MGREDQDVGVVLATALHRMMAAFRALTQDHAAAPGPDAPLHREIEASANSFGTLEEFKHPLAILPHVVMARTWLLDDFLRGVAMVATQGWQAGRTVVFSAAPIARGALEALAYIHWLSEGGIGAERRAGRFVRDMHHVVRTRHRLYEHRPPEWGEWDPGWDVLSETLTAWGVHHRREERPPRAVILERHERRPAAFDILAPLMRSEDGKAVGQFFYSDISDLAHASAEGVLRRARLEERSDGGVHYRFSRDDQLLALLALPWAIPPSLRQLSQLMGWPDEELDSEFRGALDTVSNWMRIRMGRAAEVD